MKLDEFLTKYAGKKVDFDNTYGAQCVDLFRQYCKDVLNIPHTGSVDPDGAQGIWKNYDKLPLEQKYFERVDAGYMPMIGDVAVWNGTMSNEYGHVAIVLGYSFGDILVFEQNGFTQKGAEFKIRTIHDLLGFLRKKNG